VVDVADGADVEVRLVALELPSGHAVSLSSVLADPDLAEP
jgi:hypothetical protein